MKLYDPGADVSIPRIPLSYSGTQMTDVLHSTQSRFQNGSKITSFFCQNWR